MLFEGEGFKTLAATSDHSTIVKTTSIVFMNFHYSMVLMHFLLFTFQLLDKDQFQVPWMITTSQAYMFFLVSKHPWSFEPVTLHTECLNSTPIHRLSYTPWESQAYMFLIRLKCNLYAIYIYIYFGVLVIAIITLNVLKYKLLLLWRILILKLHSIS